MQLPIKFPPPSMYTIPKLKTLSSTIMGHTQMVVRAFFMATLISFLHLAPTVLTLNIDIPADETKLDEWIDENIKDLNEHKAAAHVTLDKVLATAEETAKVIRVRKNGRGDFKTITEAIKSIPDGNTQRVVVSIGRGKYNEKIVVNCTKPFVTFYGSQTSIPEIFYHGTAKMFGTVNSATVAVEADYFMAVNIAFVNTAPKPDGKMEKAQAVAMRISGNKAAFYNCKFIGFQDTLCDDRGLHYFQDCYIEGTVDFIFGNGKSVYLNTTIVSVDSGVITAHARQNETDESGFTFVYCNLTGTGKTELGRAWKERPRVVFAYTYMGPSIAPNGWSDGNHPERQQTVYYAEYKCTGPGAQSAQRAKYAKTLTDQQAKPFLSLNYIRGTEWLLSPPTKH